MSDLAIEIANVTVRYGRYRAVDDVTLAVPRGAVYALLGRNGAGKSSLVRCLLGQQKPAAGSVRLFAHDAWRERAVLMQRIGVITEHADAPPDMTVAGIERFCSALYTRWDRNEVEERLRRFGVRSNARFGSLSKGEKKQVLLALALAMSPDLLILDDPTLGLDVVARKSLFDEVIGELADRGITVFLTTHDLAGIETIADRIAILKKGRLILEEDLDAVKARFRRIRVASRAVAFEGAAAIRNWGGGSEAIVSNYNEVAFAHLGNAEVTPMSLEEIFLAVAGENEGAVS